MLIGGATLTTKAPVEEFTPGDGGGVFSIKQSSESLPNLFFHSATIIPLRPDEILLCGGSFFDGTDALNAPMKENAYILSHITSDSLELGEDLSMESPHLMPNMVELGTRSLLISGGFVDLSLTPGQALELFNPADTTFSVPFAGGTDTTLSTPRGGHSTIAISGGRALCAGGLGSDGLLGSAEIFTPGEVQP
jgi:hypothetical protein